MEDYNLINKEAYDNNADFYSSIYNKTKFGDDYFLMLEGFAFMSGKKVLDLGSGNGFFAKKLSEMGLDVICLDNSLGMLKRGNCDKRVLASLEEIPLKSHSIEGVFANCSMLHLPKYNFPAALKEVKRILITYGMFMITMKSGKDNFEGIIEENGIKRFQSFYEERALYKIISDNFNLHRLIKFNYSPDKYLVSFLCNSIP